MASVHMRLMEIWRAAARAGVPLPPEATLAERLGVGRTTVREALARLEQDGLVTRRASSGTFPNPAALEMGLRLNESFEFSDMLRAAGLEPSMEIIDAGWTTLPPDAAARLKAAPETPTYRTVKRWLADGKPVMIATDLIPSRHDAVTDLDPSSAVFDLVHQLRGTSVEWEMTWLRAKTADARERDLLALPRGNRTTLELTMLGVSIHGAPLYIAYETHRQGIVPYGMIRRVPHYEAREVSVRLH